MLSSSFINEEESFLVTICVNVISTITGVNGSFAQCV